MSKMNRIISIILCFTILINFGISSFHIDYAAGQANPIGAPTGEPALTDQRYYYSTQTGLKRGTNNSIKMTVTEPGVYEMFVLYQGNYTQYEVQGSDGKPLGLASTPSNPLTTSANGTTVRVYLEPGDYKIPVYADIDDGSNVVVSMRKTYDGSEGVKVYDVPSSDYTHADKRGEYTGVSSSGIPSGQELSKVDEDDVGRPSYSSMTNSKDENVDFVQRAITWLFVCGVADQLRAIIIMLFGNVSIDDLVFNKYSNTKLAFYKDNGAGNATEKNVLIETPDGKGILKLVSVFYGVFRGLAISFYLIMLLFIGVRIILKSTAFDKEKYKSMLYDWLIGLVMLFLFPYVIKYMIRINETLIRLLYDKLVNSKVQQIAISPANAGIDPNLLVAMGQNEEESDSGLMMQFRNKALKTGNLGYAFVYIYVLFKLFGFLLFYFKRLITILFLIIMFPFVAITYSIDKVKDGKAQIFNNWFKELLLNIFIQFFQAVMWITVMYVVNMMIGDSTNPLIICIGIGFVSRGDALLRALFPSLLGGGKANTVTPLEQTAKTAVAMSMVKSIGDKSKKIGEKFTESKESFSQFSQSLQERNTAALENNLLDIDDRLAAQAFEPISTPEALEETINLASKKRNEGVSSNERRETAIPLRLQNLDEKFDAMDPLILGLSSPEHAKATQEALDKKMQEMNPTQRKKLETEINVKRAINELVTGKSADGRTLTRNELSLSANIVFEATQASDTDTNYKDIKEWMKHKKVTVKKKQPVDPSIKTSADAKAWSKAHKGRSAYKEKEEQVAMTDYFKFSDTAAGKKGNPDQVGDPFKGKILTKTQQQQLSAADSFLGGRSGINTGKQQSGSVNAITGEKSIGTRVKEGSDVGAGKVAALTQEEKDTIHQKKDKNGVSVVDKMVAQYGGANITDEEKAELTEAAETILELGEYNERLHTKDASKKIDGVSADEAFRLSDKLIGLSKTNSKVADMVNDSVSTDVVGSSYKVTEKVVKKPRHKDADMSKRTPKTITRVVQNAAVNETTNGVKVNLGVSLQGMRAMAAKTVLTDKQLSSDKRRTVTNDAISVLDQIADQVKEEEFDNLDDIEAAVYERSELDPYVGEDADIDAFTLDDGLVRDERTNEEIEKAKWLEEVNKRAKNNAREKLQYQNKQVRRTFVKTVKTTLDATAGTAVRVAGGTATAAMYVATSNKPNFNQGLMFANAGEAMANVAVHPASSLGNLTGEHPFQNLTQERELRNKVELNTTSKVTDEKVKKAKKSEAGVVANTLRNKIK